MTANEAVFSNFVFFFTLFFWSLWECLPFTFANVWCHTWYLAKCMFVVILCLFVVLMCVFSVIFQLFVIICILLVSFMTFRKYEYSHHTELQGPLTSWTPPISVWNHVVFLQPCLMQYRTCFHGNKMCEYLWLNTNHKKMPLVYTLYTYVNAWCDINTH